MQRIFYFLIFTISLTSCDRDNATDNTKLIYERLHGKYKPVQSVSSEPIDVNMDGTATINVLTEMPDLQNSKLEIRIVDKDKFLFVQPWPNQVLGYGPEPTSYNPSIAINYVQNAIVRFFSFDINTNTIQLHPDQSPIPDQARFPFPSEVTMDSNNRIQVTITKRLFTFTGWKTVSITTLYERYTMET